MIHPFNSRELLYTTDMSVYALVRDVLFAEKIHFVRNPFFATWYRYADTRAGNNMEYRIYVKKCDYERALHAINEARKNMR